MVNFSTIAWAGAGLVVAAGAGLSLAVSNFSRMNVRNDLRYATLSEADLQARLKGRIAYIVGGTKGIGRALALALAQRGASVAFCGRADSTNLLAALKSANPSGQHMFFPADLSLATGAIEAAQDFMKHYKKVDLLVFTVGIITSPKREESKDGVEIDYAVSHLSRFIMLKEMLPFLRAQVAAGEEKARVIIYGFPGGKEVFNVADPQSKVGYKAWPAHMQTVVANEAWVHQLSHDNYKDVQVFGVNPGLIATDIRRNLIGQTLTANTIEFLIGLLGRSLDGHVSCMLQLLASPELSSAPWNGTLFNTYGEPIQPNSTLLRLERKQTAEGGGGGHHVVEEEQGWRKVIQCSEELYASLMQKKRQ